MTIYIRIVEGIEVKITFRSNTVGSITSFIYLFEDLAIFYRLSQTKQTREKLLKFIIHSITFCLLGNSIIILLKKAFYHGTFNNAPQRVNKREAAHSFILDGKKITMFDLTMRS